MYILPVAKKWFSIRGLYAKKSGISILILLSSSKVSILILYVKANWLHILIISALWFLYISMGLSHA